MAYQLVKGVFRVKCGHTGCPFDHPVKISQKLMGLTETDVENEAHKMARDIALMKHDAIYGNKHTLTKPDIRKVGGAYVEVGPRAAEVRRQPQAMISRDFRKGDKILQKGETATTICEVVRGYAYPERDHSYRYRVGDCFGSAALLSEGSRTANIIAGEDGTRVTFHNLLELRKKDPQKAGELYGKAMEDIFHVVSNLEKLVSRLEKRLEKEEIAGFNQRERIKALEKELKQKKAE
jgi:hypothetical protein